jgi:hypothetical protein
MHISPWWQSIQSVVSAQQKLKIEWIRLQLSLELDQSLYDLLEIIRQVSTKGDHVEER